MDNNRKSIDLVDIVSVKDAISKIMKNESKYIPVASVCNSFTKRLDAGENNFALYEEFIAELSKVAQFSAAKEVLTKLVAESSVFGRDLDVIKKVVELRKSPLGYITPSLENALVEYMSNKNPETRDALVEVLKLFGGVQQISSIKEYLQYDRYEEQNGKKLSNVLLKENKVEKTYTQSEVDSMIAKQVQEAKDEEAKRIAESNSVKKTIKMIDSHINLHESINRILKASFSNEKLKVFCEQYIDALNSGKSSEMLVESFISGVTNWNYMNAVDTEVSALSDRVKKYRQEIDLKRILETMKETGSYYIVPLIEDMVVEYLENKTMTGRALLKNRLSAFEYDPFVRDILTTISKDDSINVSMCLGESLEAPHANVHTEAIYSPIHMVNESGFIFNVKGTYYIKDRRGINKLRKNDIVALPESFRILCNIINSEYVTINEELNEISVYAGNNSAVINESELVVNKITMTTDEFNRFVDNGGYTNESASFYKAVKMLNENFDKIATLDFVKRVVSNDNSGKAVDVFKTKTALYVNTVNESLGKSVFYRNVNPIQCKNYINEHMEINVSRLFEDVLPNQEATEKSIEDTKKSYIDKIEELKRKKEELEGMTGDEYDAETINQAKKMIEDELSSTEDDFKKYQNDVDSALGKDSNFDNSDDNDDASKESPEDMEHPLGTDTGDMNADTTNTGMDSDGFGDFDADGAGNDNFNVDDMTSDNVPEYDPTFDTVSDESDESLFQVVKVTYKQNVKTGKKSGEGETFIIIPTVNSNGDIYNETKKVTFYLDPNREPVINNDDMPLAMYRAIQDAIKNDAETQNVELISRAADNVVPTDDGSMSMDDMDNADNQDLDTTDVNNDTAAADSTVDTASATDTPDTANQLPSGEESPADTAEKDENMANYPIGIDLNISDINPIKKETFECALDKMGIKHSQKEGASNKINFVINNKSEAYALKDYFNEWRGYSTANFCNFFPELKRCFNNNSSTIPVMSEGVTIRSIRGLNESALLRDNARGCASLILPNTAAYRRVLGINEAKAGKSISIQTENAQETRELYEKLAEYGYTIGFSNLNEEAIVFLDRYKDDFKDINESYKVDIVRVPYNNMLSQKLSAKGINVVTEGERMNISIRRNDAKKAMKLFESFYGKKKPLSVKNYLKNMLEEGVKITIKDDSTGKTVEIDTSSLENGSGNENDSDVPPTDFNSSFEGTTFNNNETERYGDDPKDSDEGENNKDNKEDKKDKKDKTAKNESDESANDSEDTEKKDKGKKKVTFKFKKKDETNESFSSKTIEDVLNEAEVNVLDYVKLKNGKKGQIISKFPNDNFIVNVEGHTIECDRKDLTLVNAKPDCEVPYKFDPQTLKAIYEQKVCCGMFMNEMRITPSDCYVTYSDFMNANDSDEISILIEGVKTPVLRKYVKVLESVDNFANINDYSEAVYTEVDGRKVDVLANKKDMYGSTCRIVVNENDSYKLRFVSPDRVVIK